MKKFLSILTTLILTISFSFPQNTKISPQRQSLASYSLSLHDVPYVWGGTTTSGFDCSGFVQYVAANGIFWVEDGTKKHLNIKLPRSTNEMYAKCIPIKEEEREPGDLMFFKENPWDTKISHVGIYLGVYHENPKHPIPRFKEFEGKRVFISALSEGANRGIQLRPIDNPYWTKHFYAYGRMLPTSKQFSQGVRKIKRKTN